MTRRIPDTVETARLRGERPGPQHLDGYHALMSHPDLVPWMWPGDLGGARTREQAAEILERDARHREEWGCSPWAVVRRDTGETVGRVGVGPGRLDGEDVIELAWMVHPDHWGLGFTTEMAREAVRAAFEDLGLESLVAFTMVANERSQAVMRKLGMTYERTTDHVGLAHVVYVLRNPGQRAPTQVR